MRVKLFLILLFSVQLRHVICVELGISSENVGIQLEQIHPIMPTNKRKKPIDLNEFPSISDDSDEEEKRLNKKAKDDKQLAPAIKLTIKQIKELKGKERYQKVRARRMKLSAKELKEFRLRHNIDNKKYREDLKNKIKLATTENPTSTRENRFDLIGYRQRKSTNQKNYTERMKDSTGFSDMRQARLYEARRAKQKGTLTQEQGQLLQNEYDRKRRYYDKKKSVKIAAKNTIDKK